MKRYSFRSCPVLYNYLQVYLHGSAKMAERVKEGGPTGRSHHHVQHVLHSGVIPYGFSSISPKIGNTDPCPLQCKLHHHHIWDTKPVEGILCWYIIQHAPPHNFPSPFQFLHLWVKNDWWKSGGGGGLRVPPFEGWSTKFRGGGQSRIHGEIWRNGSNRGGVVAMDTGYGRSPGQGCSQSQKSRRLCMSILPTHVGRDRIDAPQAFPRVQIPLSLRG